MSEESVEYYGKEGRLLQTTGKLTTDRNGLASGSCLYKIRPNAWGDVPPWGMEHPYANFCHLERKSVIFGQGFWRVECEFAGCEVEETDRIYSLRRNTQREPIETNPKFVTVHGGKPSDRKHGAIFLDETGHPTSDDKLGVFDRFKILLPDGTQNKYAGLEQYLAPTNTVWSARWTSRTKPSPGEEVGKIDSSPSGSPPDYGSDFSWLYTGMQYDTRAKSYSVGEEWLLGMWLPEVYG